MMNLLNKLPLILGLILVLLYFQNNNDKVNYQVQQQVYQVKEGSIYDSDILYLFSPGDQELKSQICFSTLKIINKTFQIISKIFSISSIMNYQKILPPFWFLFSIILMGGFHLLLPVKQLITQPFNYTGVVAIIIGIFMAVSCSQIFRQKGTTIKPFEESSYLVKEGLFRYSRNPIYLGMIVFLFGLWIVLGSLMPVVVMPVFIWLIQEKFIKEEEKMLCDKFGEEYREYKTKVRRWI